MGGVPPTLLSPTLEWETLETLEWETLEWEKGEWEESLPLSCFPFNLTINDKDTIDDHDTSIGRMDLLAHAVTFFFYCQLLSPRRCFELFVDFLYFCSSHSSYKMSIMKIMVMFCQKILKVIAENKLTL